LDKKKEIGMTFHADDPLFPFSHDMSQTIDGRVNKNDMLILLLLYFFSVPTQKLQDSVALKNCSDLFVSGYVSYGRFLLAQTVYLFQCHIESPNKVVYLLSVSFLLHFASLTSASSTETYR
jgi:hypothetical protein